MINQWKPVKDKDKYGIAIYNYHQEAEYRIKLLVGEAVHILEENGEWFFGYSSKNRAVRGIFPKSYIHTKESAVDKTGPVEVVTLKQSPVIREITSVLREWGLIWKHLYVTHSPLFSTIEKRIFELLCFRSKIMSGTLPIDELKDLKQQVTSKIDVGNKLLDLDMVVRDQEGNVLNPDETSSIQLYAQHKMATERIKRANSQLGRSVDTTRSLAPQHSHIVFVSVRNFVCKMSEDAELLMTLYDAGSGKEAGAITENYVVQWSKQGLTRDIDQMHNLRVLFTDLGSADLSREKVYLVCYVVRVGAMESRDVDHRRTEHRRSSAVRERRPGAQDNMRRPFGVAAMDITPYICGKLDSNEEKHHFIPFLHCEKDNMEGTLKRILSKDIPARELKGQGLWASLKLLHGDIKQVREENPHLVLGNVAVARKMGFPEVILPGDVRNDLYLTLVAGEFSKGSKSTDKNVEVTVAVCNEKGQTIPGVIYLGGGVEPLNEYHSVIYYHEDKPRWCETFKVAIPIEEFKAAHLKFTYKHRSSNESKDKTEKPFAMSFVKLMQANGTTLNDTQHELLVYKLEHKKLAENEAGYMDLPATRMDSRDGKVTVAGMSLSSKDSLTISTNVCSTKLTQNVKLLGLLNWSSDPAHIKESLLALMFVDGEEVVKFLQDVLDALFNILMYNSETDKYDNMVFECLIHIIQLVSNQKYQHFQPVLDLYIQESFSATLAYNKLIAVLKTHIDNANVECQSKENNNILLKSMKSLQYIVRFIVRSRLLFSELNEGKGRQQFEASLKQLIHSFIALMCYTSKSTLTVQGACLKYLPTTIPDILAVFASTQLSTLLMELITKVPVGRLTNQKLVTVNDIVHSQLFLCPDCRAIILPVVLTKIKEHLEQGDEGRVSEIRKQSKSHAKIAKVLGASREKLAPYQGPSEEMELCVKVLSDVLELLFRADVGPTLHDVSEIMLRVLRTVIQTTIAMDRENALVGNLVAAMVSIFRQMTAHHFDTYIRHFATTSDLLDFLMEILLVFRDLVSRPVFPKDWCDMILLQNSVILKSLRFFSHTIRDYFSSPLESQAWNNFFHCAIAFLTQPALQLETFSPGKRARIVARYKDMRRETGFEIRSMWFNLGQYKMQFVPGLVGAFLEMTLIPETELRRATIPIFFDMMQCEFYSSRLMNESFGDTKRDSSQIKAHFREFEQEMIAKLDTLVEGGRGDEHYKDLFHSVMSNLCENHATMREQGRRFVSTVTRLMERLLEYRCIITDENKENRMSCTVNLLEFYSEINRKEMYIRYVNKLCDLHLDCDDFTEAAFTLQLHSNLLSWSDQRLSPLLRSDKYPACQTHRELKEKLYKQMIEDLDKGKMWECAIQLCKELVHEYESEVYDYAQLGGLLQRMARLYEKIMTQIRPEPEYFRVAYYGRGFPAFLQNKVFVYRGKEYERLSDFSSRTLNQLPNAELMNKLTLPGEDVMESPHQFVQINKVEPMMSEQKRFSGKPISDQILKYHRVNEVQKFRFNRPYHKRDSNGGSENEFASLWLERTVLVTSYPLPGILRWFPVTAANTFNVSPLTNAIETMEASNKSLRDLIVSHRNDPTLQLNPLSLKINGIVDAAVMGGVTNYEEAFFTAEYRTTHMEQSEQISKLEDLIACQIPLLEVAISIHKVKAPPSLAPLQQHQEECFARMRAHVQAKYGKKTCDLQVEPVVMRRAANQANIDHRLSELSMASSDGGSRSRVSSLTRSQVANLKNLVNFNNSGTLSRVSSSPVSPTARFTRSASLTPSIKVGVGKKDKEKKEKRRLGRKSDVTSKWYTPIMPETPIVELRQELTAKRPLRSEVERERRLSRPNSGTFSRRFSVGTASICENDVSSRDSLGTNDSTASEEDQIPPPLPAKSREADYCNLPESAADLLRPLTLLSVPSRFSVKPMPPEPLEGDRPPTPPPKRPHMRLPDS